MESLEICLYMSMSVNSVLVNLNFFNYAGELAGEGGGEVGSGEGAG